MGRPPSLPLRGRPKSRRLIARFSVLLRREGGSLSITIPRYIARHWQLEPGARLVVRSTDEGVLLYPRYFAPYVDRTWMRGDPEHDDEYDEVEAMEAAPTAAEPEDADDADDADDTKPSAETLTLDEPPTASAR
jgi:antitoxin component of MazEF toxin-antitoxin module